MKRRGIVAIKTTVIIVAAIILSTLSINAIDNIDYPANSLVASIFSAFAGKKSPCPKDMTFVSDARAGFCIDVYENSAGPGCQYEIPRNQTETRINLEQQECKPTSEPERPPWVQVSNNQAVLACAKAGKRLPTNKEWYRAALGTPDGLTGLGKSGCNIGNLSSGADPAGMHDKCVSVALAYDMIGNVWEWVDETISDGALQGRTLPAQGYIQGVDSDGIPTETNDSANLNYGGDYFWINASSTMGMFRGGFWGKSEELGIYAIYAASPPSFVGEAVGFRCVKSIE